ncbi:uncharacterized protein VTP21DRAFT_3091 [Calcarisporiella thermophila]|uniref:uncharacterized protein n=1 Tax=Calcarisporiella thermophila TaxID=911321 RepID=UPI0037427B47
MFGRRQSGKSKQHEQERQQQQQQEAGKEAEQSQTEQPHERQLLQPSTSAPALSRHPGGTHPGYRSVPGWRPLKINEKFTGFAYYEGGTSHTRYLSHLPETPWPHASAFDELRARETLSYFAEPYVAMFNDKPHYYCLNCNVGWDDEEITRKHIRDEHGPHN